MSKGNRTRRKELGLLPARSYCSARKKDGTPCRRAPINGASVCRVHGGAAPQVVAAAKRRLMEASKDMAALLMRIAEDEAVPPAVRLGAIRDVLDRAGVTAKTEVEITVAPWQQLIDGIVSEVDDDRIRPQSRYLQEMFADVVDAEVVLDEPDPRPLPTAQGLVPSEVRIPSRRKKAKGNWR